jgi:hypothetical protein
VNAPFKPIRGQVVVSGGGQVAIVVDRDTEDYVPVNARVLITSDPKTSAATEDDGAGSGPTGTAATPAAATAPGPSDPLDTAAIRTLPDSTAQAAGVDAYVVPLSVAKRIRDEAVADAKAELDGLYKTLADVSRAIGRHLPDGIAAPETLTAGIRAVHEHAFAQGAAYAAHQIADAMGDIGEIDEEVPT